MQLTRNKSTFSLSLSLSFVPSKFRAIDMQARSTVKMVRLLVLREDALHRVSMGEIGQATKGVEKGEIDLPLSTTRSQVYTWHT